LVGAALNRGALQESAYPLTAAREFNYVTPENETKWVFTETSPGRVTFGAADAIVEFAEAQGMKVKGHTLIWHELLASYVNETLAPDELRGAVEAHIAGVVGHFRGRMYAWDVVNEAIDHTTNGLRNTIFLQTLGPTYIAEAFRLAHQVDPDVLLTTTTASTR
jgi:endo-1,4-beta-xylanase